jgi:hypothetical protein
VVAGAGIEPVFGLATQRLRPRKAVFTPWDFTFGGNFKGVEDFKDQLRKLLGHEFRENNPVFPNKLHRTKLLTHNKPV